MMNNTFDATIGDDLRVTPVGNSSNAVIVDMHDDGNNDDDDTFRILLNILLFNILLYYNLNINK